MIDSGLVDGYHPSNQVDGLIYQFFESMDFFYETFSSIQINLAVAGPAIDRWIWHFLSMAGTLVS